MKSQVQATADYVAKGEYNETQYVSIRDVVSQRLHRAMMIKNAYANYELKLEKASIELDEELGHIDNNYKAVL